MGHVIFTANYRHYDQLESQIVHRYSSEGNLLETTDKGFDSSGRETSNYVTRYFYNSKKQLIRKAEDHTNVYNSGSEIELYSDFDKAGNYLKKEVIRENTKDGAVLNRNSMISKREIEYYD